MAGNNGLGMNWIRKEKRLAIYLRDGLACAYCGGSVEDGWPLTLDHLRPRSKGGKNEATNLVTACALCNAERGAKPLSVFARSRARGAKSILAHVKNTARRRLNLDAAKALIAARGSLSAALEAA